MEDRPPHMSVSSTHRHFFFPIEAEAALPRPAPCLNRKAEQCFAVEARHPARSSSSRSRDDELGTRPAGPGAEPARYFFSVASLPSYPLDVKPPDLLTLMHWTAETAAQSTLWQAPTFGTRYAGRV